MSVIGIADRRPDDGTALVRDQLLPIGIAIIGRSLEVAAERGLRIGNEGRPVEMAVELDQERPVVGNQLGKQRYEEQDREYPERPVTPLVRSEILPASAVERRWARGTALRRLVLAERNLHRAFDVRRGRDRHQTSRVSTSIRGSTHV